MNCHKSDFAINGVRLCQHIRTLKHLLTGVSKIYEGFAPGLSQWDWKCRREVMKSPLRIKFVEGIVAEVSGSELTWNSYKFGRTSDQTEILETLPRLSLEKLTSTNRLHILQADFELSIGLVPRFRSYCLRDVNLSTQWANRYFNDSARSGD